jgi:gliding motility-associated-like protein
LSNDGNTEGGTLAVTPVTVTNASGTFVMKADGTYTFTPAPGFSGPVDFPYTVCGGTPQTCATATVHILVDPKPAPQIDLRKTVDAITATADGKYEVKFKIKVTNRMSVAADSVMVQDDLTKVFGSATAYKVISTEASGTLIKNNLYNGDGVIELLTTASTLGGNKSDSIYLTVVVEPGAGGGQFSNIAKLNANTPFGNIIGLTSDDPSINPTDTTGAVNRDATPFVIPAVDIVIPGGFSPNLDGIDDAFIITAPPGSKVALKIYNRWQHKIYQSDDYLNDWRGEGPGSVFGNYVPMGTYYYVVSITLSGGEVKKFAGTLTLVK